LALVVAFAVFLGIFLVATKRIQRVAQGAAAQDARGTFNSPQATNSKIEGKIWVVGADEASHVMFPPPRRTPDATFTTAGISFTGGAPDRCYTLITFLNGCANRISELKFSGLPNPNLGDEAASPNTAMSGPNWGILIEFTGTANLVHGQKITILHDDGVALTIDGEPIPGFNPFITMPTEESAVFTGSSGMHSYDLLYANAAGGGGGAWILFYPALF
jgi:hypothetical protein